MCGRVKQAGDPIDYFSFTRWDPAGLFDFAPSANRPPGTRPLVLHRLGDGAEQADCLFWGYLPPWPGYKRGPASNARLDKVLGKSPFWRPLLSRRIIMPCEGWYEWVGPKGDKQPWYISPKDGKPLLMAGIAGWQPGQDADERHGFAIVTDDAAGGLVDLHDRRPICLTLDDARQWMDPTLGDDYALDLLTTPRPESAFQWWEVARKMGNSRYQLADASEPV